MWCYRDITPVDTPELLGNQCLTTPYPITIVSGNKYLGEVDVPGNVLGGLEISRHYNALGGYYTLQTGANWKLSLDRSLSFETADMITAYREDGRQVNLVRSGDQFRPSAGGGELVSRLLDTGGTITGWRYTDAHTGAVERYDTSGRLLSLTNARGQTWTLTRDKGRIVSVANAYGAQVILTYDSKYRLGSLSLPNGGQITYGYDANGNLTFVTYPDGTIKGYGYNEAGQTNGALPNALTSITDENGVRYITYTYDSTGRAIGEVVAGNVGRHTLTFNTGNTVVTDPLGTSRTYNFQTVLGVARNAGQTQPGGAGCGASASALTYDANGNIASRTDFNGVVTTYGYDLTRNLETQRVEASGKPESRTISTQWHAYWRQPVKLAEPKKLTTWTYNGDGGVYCAPTTATVPSITGGTQPIGVVCSKTEQATTDLTGSAAFTAAATGNPRTWTYTYNQYGQILTANGPRTDVSDVTTYTYYAADDPDIGKRGNIATTNNSQGHLTRYTAYDLNGRLLSMTDPNSVVTTLSYWPRGWLKSKRVGSDTSTYDYTPWGGLEKVTYADSTWVEYDYDAAHRLTGMADRKGNRVIYTLDAMGNTTRTEWRNADGTPAKQNDATFDALGRLYQEITTRNAVGYTTTHAYDANGNPTSTTNPKGKSTTVQYDALGNPTKITDALNGQTILTQDRQDQLTQFKAPNNAVTSFTVDGLGNVTQEVSADRGTRTMTYDAAGNQLTVSDDRGIVETRTYDALNRPLTAKFATTGEDLTWTWDSATGCTNGIGRLCKITDNGGSTTFAYDSHGNLTGETRTEGSVTLNAATYQWNASDRLQALVTPSGKVLSLQREIDGRIQQVATEVGGKQVSLVDNIQTDALGNTLSQNYGNGATLNRAYNTDGSLSGQTDAAPVTPWLRSNGVLFDYAALQAAIPQIAWQNPGWHLIPDDIDRDGDIDLVLYFNGAGETYVDLACGSSCSNAYTGPEFGVLVYLENVNGSYVRRSFTANQHLVTGDLAQLIPVDYNNDGKTDLLLVLDPATTSSSNASYKAATAFRRLVLFKNDSGTSYVTADNPNGTHFTDVTTTVGLNTATTTAEGLVLDLNNDGYPDILGQAKNTAGTLLGDAYVFNPATGAYTPMTTTGLPRPLSKAGLIDIDGDGKLDLVTQDASAGLSFYRNPGTLAFTAWTNATPLTPFTGRWISQFLPADMDNDSQTDLVLVETDQEGVSPYLNYNGARLRLLRHGGITGSTLTMTEQTVAGFAPSGNDDEIAFGGSVGDLNNDGYLDIILAARNDGSRVLVSDGTGGYARPEASGAVSGLTGSDSRYANPTLLDINLDGRLDLFAPEGNDFINNGNYLLTNTGVATGTRKGITLELTGQNKAAPSSGKDAYGARVQVTAGGITQTRQVLPGMGNARRLHFGLGTATSGIAIKIYWPDSTTPQTLSGDAYLNSILRVSQP